MTRLMRTSRAGIELIKSFEGFRPRAVQVREDQWLIGFGHTKSARENLRVSRQDAISILKEYDLPPIEKYVSTSTLTPLHQNEFDALVSFAFNIGEEAFIGSDVLARLNSGEKLAAAEGFGAWRKARIEGRLIIVDALVRRRAAEKALFLEHPSGRPEAPSALIRPQLDIAAHIMTPRDRAVVIETAMDGDTERAIREDSDTQSVERRKTTIATEDASERVRERMSKILNERPNTDSEGSATAGPSPEEITAAVSALVGDAQPELDSPPPRLTRTLDRLSPDDLIDDLDAEPLTLTDEVPPVIDDLEPVEIAMEDIEAAMAVHEDMNRSALSLMDWGPFALLSAIGAAIFGWGGWKVGSLLQSGEDLSVLKMSAGPFALILGGLLFLIMFYYLWRAVFGQDR